VEKYIHEFEQLQIRSGLEEEPNQIMARFLRGLDPSIAEKVDLQPYWSFEDVCKLATKVEKYSKNKWNYAGSYPKPNVPPKVYSASKPKVSSKEDRSKDNGKGIQRVP